MPTRWRKVPTRQSRTRIRTTMGVPKTPGRLLCFLMHKSGQEKNNSWETRLSSCLAPGRFKQFRVKLTVIILKSNYAVFRRERLRTPLAGTASPVTSAPYATPERRFAWAYFVFSICKLFWRSPLLALLTSSLSDPCARVALRRPSIHNFGARLSPRSSADRGGLAYIT